MLIRWPGRIAVDVCLKFASRHGTANANAGLGAHHDDDLAGIHPQVMDVSGFSHHNLFPIQLPAFIPRMTASQNGHSSPHTSRMPAMGQPPMGGSSLLCSAANTPAGRAMAPMQ